MTRAVERTRSMRGSGPLSAELAVGLSVDSECPLRGLDLDEVNQSFARSEGPERYTCQIAADGVGDRGFRRTGIGEACPCAVFMDHECVADLESVRDGSLRYSVVVPDRSTLRSIVDDLRDAGGTVSLERIRMGIGERVSSRESVPLTDKQREVLELAIESGYYDRPRGATLDDLADALDVTPSAVSQRLNAIERNLVRERAWADDLHGATTTSPNPSGTDDHDS